MYIRYYKDVNRGTTERRYSITYEKGVTRILSQVFKFLADKDLETEIVNVLIA